MTKRKSIGLVAILALGAVFTWYRLFVHGGVDKLIPDAWLVVPDAMSVLTIIAITIGAVVTFVRTMNHDRPWASLPTGILGSLLLIEYLASNWSKLPFLVQIAYQFVIVLSVVGIGILSVRLVGGRSPPLSTGVYQAFWFLSVPAPLVIVVMQVHAIGLL